MIATYHNHSSWSDGRSPFAEMYAFAESVGVDLLGLSDHFCVLPDGTSPDWSLQPGKVEAYLADVKSFQAKGEIEVIVGLEFDWFENHDRMVRPYVEGISLDYRIGAVHHVEGRQFDVDISYWSDRTEEARDQIYVKYWRLIGEMAESRLFDIVAHIDLPKKLGFYACSDLSLHIDAALDAIRESDMVVELNTAGFGKLCADGYPSLQILQKCEKRGIPITLSSDGHIPEHILFEFERGLARLYEAGFTSIAWFRNRERFFEPLADALKSKRANKAPEPTPRSVTPRAISR
jgi:histidinol-phosphatase (PHP family)